MKTLPADLEALMPEPIGYLTDWPAIGGGLRKLFGPTRTAGDALAFKVDPLFTADQVREAMLAATERAAKLCEAESERISGLANAHIAFGRINYADRLAAAIRSGGEAGS